MSYESQWLDARNSASHARARVREAVRRGALVGAAGRVDITPPLGLPPGGHGFGFADLVGVLTHGHTAQQAWGRLHATVLLLEDVAGSGVALIATDLHCGTRYLAEAVARRVAPRTGLGIERIFLGASHAHSGPGHLYGDSFYDDNAAHATGLDRETAEDIAARIAGCIVDTYGRLAPVHVRNGTAHAWGTLWNRSHLAALANAGEPNAMRPAARLAAARALSRDMNGQAGPAGLDAARLLVDARVQALLLTDPDDVPLGAWAVCHATPTALPGTLRLLSPDCFGVAVHEARRRFEARTGAWMEPLGLSAGAMGDVNVLPRGMKVQAFRDARFGVTAGGASPSERELAGAEEVLDLSRRVGEELGEALEEALAAAWGSPAREVSAVTVHFAEPCVASARAASGERLPERWMAGRATLAKSELARQADVGALFAEEESDRARKEAGEEPLLMEVDASDPHSPKRPLAGIPGLLQQVIDRAPGLAHGWMPPFVALRRVRIGPLQLVGLPVEPSAALGRAIARGVLPADGSADDVLVSGLNGGCVGYAGTRAEYRVQDYEGASTFWGRAFGDWLVEQVSAAPVSAPGRSVGGDAVFVGTLMAVPPQRLAMPLKRSVDGVADEALAALACRRIGRGARRRLRVEGWWRADACEALPPLADAPWVLLTTGDGVPLRIGGRIVDDRAWPCWIRREVHALRGGVTFAFAFDLPEDALPPRDTIGFRVTGPEAVRPAARWRPPVARVPR